MVSDAEKRRVGALIRARRQELGLRQHQFADRVGVSRNAASNWETGRAYPERYAGKIEAVLRISLSEGAPDPQELEIRELGARLGLAPGDQDAWIEIYRRRPPPAGERTRAAV